MKTVIFAGGLGTRISEESHLKPKPMVEIGGKPILWHIMKLYQHYGYNEFVICLGYKGYVIKEYFANYFLHHSDVTINISTNELEVHKKSLEDFKVTLVETGLNTMTAGRLKKIEPYINDDENFMLTYGDGVSDVNIGDLVSLHLKRDKICTMTTIQPSGKFGVLEVDEANLVRRFTEKPQNSNTWINGGFFVLNKKVFQYLNENSDQVMWEQDPIQQLVKANEIVAYKHAGFWKSMDILRDKVELEEMWNMNPKWKVWD